MADKKFFRVRLADNSPLATKMVNGLVLTRQWQVKVGEASAFAGFADVEAQTVVKQGNGFIPAEEASGVATGGSGGNSGQTPGSASTPARDEDGTEIPPDFDGMTVEQLKSFLIAKGVSPSDLKNAPKQDLIERSEFLWSQS